MKLAFRFALALGALAFSLAAAQEKPAAPAAGVIDFVEGDSIVESRAGARIAKAADPVYQAESITTFAGAEVHLKMADGAYLSLRENSKITITAYVANGDDGDQSLIDLAKGAFRSVTGWIGKYRRAAYQVRTPMVTLGVRGTDHEPTHLLPGDPRGEPGSYDKVNEGRTFMKSEFGTVEVLPNRAAHFTPERRAPPRLLASVPAFFKPARNEHKFVERARASARNLEAQRETRREALRKQRGSEAGKAPRKPEPPAQKARPQPQKAAPQAQKAASPAQKPKPQVQTARPRAPERIEKKRFEKKQFEKKNFK